MRRPGDEMPPRLLDGEGEVAELLRKVERQARQVPSETAAWDGTLRRLGRDSGAGRLRVGMAAAAGALAGAVTLYVALSRTADLRPMAATTGRSSVADGRGSTTAAVATRSPPASVSRSGGTSPEAAAPVSALPRDLATGARAEAGSTRRAPTTVDRVAADIPHIQLGRAAVGLPAGHTELLGEADVLLSRGGTARAFATAAAATVDLDAGEVELHVEKRPPEVRHAFEVTAGGYRFTALGTTFRVARASGDVTLSVTEGRVAVSQGTTHLAVVTAGGFWAGTTREARARRSAELAMTGSPVRAQPPAEAGWSGAVPPPSGGGASAFTARPDRSAFGAATRPSSPLTPPSLAASPVVAPAAAAVRPSQATFEPALAPPATAAGNAARAPSGSGAGVPVRALTAALGGRPIAARSTPASDVAASVVSGGCSGSATGGAPAARRTAAAEVECLLGKARGSDLGAEVALYEAARLYRDALGDTGHAIATLRELRRRFPSGALAAEADLSLAELLPAVGRYREALAETAAVLGAHPTPERTAEIHLLRGDLLRTGLGDCRAAATEYAQATERGPDAVADPAAFFAGVCLQKLGDAAGARRVFESYLARPHPRRPAEARRRLGELDRPGR